MVFKKISDSKYYTEVTTEVVDLINNMINQLSLDSSLQYEDNVNRQLFNIMLSRHISALFHKQNNVVSELGFITVDVSINNIILTISLGNADFGDKVGIKRLNGVLYK